jgi:O-antigen ligase
MKANERSMFSAANLDILARGLWAIVLVCLPVTSFRYFPFLGDSTYVRPLSLYPLALLLPILLIQGFRRERRLEWPGSMILITIFTLAVLVATGFGALLDPIPLRGQAYLDRVLRAWLTLLIGISFFVSAAWMNRDEANLKFTVKWLLVGFGLDLAWSGLQGVTFYTPLLKKVMVTHWQLAFSMRELVRTNRISGLAYEPAWLAGQIATLYYPCLFACLLTGERLTRYKWVEPVLLVFATVLLLATYSRGGLLEASGAAALTFLFAGREHLRAAWDWFASGFRSDGTWVLRILMISSIVVAVGGVLLILGQKGYIARMWDTQAASLQEFLVENSAGARAAYSTAAMVAYEEHAWTGVGLGASGFYIYENLPDWSLTTVPEIARQLSPENRLYPNPKNLYVRLLAETGLIGFVLFLVFQLAILGDTLTALGSTGLTRFLGVAGLFAWLAIGLYNFTQDSFASPNIWLIPGILAGMSNFSSSSHIHYLMAARQENE